MEFIREDQTQVAVTWKTVRVFISSTFRDMHAERDYLVKVVFPRVRAWCEKRRLRLVDIDLRWGITDTEARSGKIVDICMQEIDGSRPFFLALIGSRYGSVPADICQAAEGDWITRPNDKGFSITHWEILHAVLSPIPSAVRGTPQRCARSLFCIRNSSSLPDPELERDESARNNYRTAFFEPEPGQPDRSTSLHRLLIEIENCVPVQRILHYSANWDPGAVNPEDENLKGRLTGLAGFGCWVLRRLLQDIRAEFHDHLTALGASEAPSEEEAAAHWHYAELSCDRFVPRPEAERELNARIEQVSSRAPLFIVGPSGSGKTALLARWGTKHLQAGEAIVLRFVGATPTSTDLISVLRSICKELVVRYALQDSPQTMPSTDQASSKNVSDLMSIPKDEIEFLCKWPMIIDAVSVAIRNSPVENARIVIFIDGLDHLDDRSLRRRLHWVPGRLPDRIALVLSINGKSPLSADLDEGWPQMPVAGMSELESHSFIVTVPSVFSKTMSAEHAALLLGKPAARYPMFLALALEELRVFGGFGQAGEALRAQIENLPADEDAEVALVALFARKLHRIGSDLRRQSGTIAALPPDSNLAAILLGFVAQSRDGLSASDLRGVMAQEFPAVPSADRNGLVEILLRQMRQHIVRRAHRQGTLLSIPSAALRDAIKTANNAGGMPPDA
jgi:telomerase protein component 1